MAEPPTDINGLSYLADDTRKAGGVVHHINPSRRFQACDAS